MCPRNSCHAVIKDDMPANVHHSYSMSEALSVEGDPLLLFVDDNAASGVQSTAQMYSFSGAAVEDWPPELQRETKLFKALPPEDWGRLRERRWGIAVAAGAKTALWQPGRFQGRPWVPMLLRRGRFSELILG